MKLTLSRRAVTAAITTLVLAVPVLGQDADLGKLLEQAREAAGHTAFADCREGFLLTGSGQVYGFDADFELLVNADGRFRRDFRGELPLTVAFDGTEAWELDRVGLARPLMLEEEDRVRLLGAVLTGQWMAVKSALERRVVASEDSSVGVELGLPGSPMRMTLLVDRESGLVRSLERKSETGLRRWLFDDYRDVHGVELPHRIRKEVDGLELETMRVESADRAPAIPADPFERPNALPQVTFDASVSPELEVKKARSGHLLVHPRVDGKDIGWFIFDTGAGAMCIDPEAANELGLAEVGKIDVVGATGTTAGSFREAGRFSLGPISYENPLFVQIELSQLSPFFGVELAGICGYDLWARAVVEIETAAGYVALHDPEKYELHRGVGEEGANWTKLVLDDRLPCLEARFEGDHEGIFKIDTGNPAGVIMHAPAVERLGLLEGREVRRGQVGGVGGVVEVSIGNLDWFELGGERFENPQVTFFHASVGALADDYTTGNLGQAVLEPFRLVFDYQSRRMALPRVRE